MQISIDLESVKTDYRQDLIIMETVQGEGGIYPAEPASSGRTETVR